MWQCGLLGIRVGEAAHPGPNEEIMYMHDLPGPFDGDFEPRPDLEVAPVTPEDSEHEQVADEVMHSSEMQIDGAS
eukprot:10019960-Karenia_brevis.AAC.1